MSTTDNNTPNYVLYVGDPSSPQHPPVATFRDLNLRMVPGVIATMLLFSLGYSDIGDIVQTVFGFLVIATATNSIIRTDRSRRIGACVLSHPNVDIIPDVPYGFYLPKSFQQKHPDTFRFCEDNFRRSETSGFFVYIGQMTNDKFIELMALQGIDMDSAAPSGHLSLASFNILPFVKHLLAAFFEFNMYTSPTGGFGSRGCLGLSPDQKTSFAMSMPAIGGVALNVEDLMRTETAGTMATEFKAVPTSWSGSHMAVRSLKTGNVYPWIGPAKNAPDGKAILFPYFDGLVRNDLSFVPTVIGRFYSSVLAESWEERNVMMESIVKCWKHIGSTTAGKVMAHMFLAVKLALESDAHVYFVVDEARLYTGFILYTRVAMYHWSGTKSPADKSEWAAQLDVFQSAAGAIKAICVILSGVVLWDGSIRTVQVEMVSSPYALAKEMEKRDLRALSSDERSVLQRLLNRVPNPQNYWVVNPETLGKMFKYLLGHDHVYDIDTPMCFQDILSVGNVDRVALALMPFGSAAPTWVSKAKEVQELQLSRGGLSFYDEKSEDGKKLRTFPVMTARVPTAVYDLRKCLANRAVYIVITPKGTGATAQRNYDKEAGKKLWEDFAAMVFEQAVVKEQTDGQTKKRKAGMDQDREEAKDKVRKMANLFKLG